MPTFAPSASKIAQVSIPVSPAGLGCTAELWLTTDGITKSATSGPVAFISTGAVLPLPQLPIVMPSVAASYQVNLEIFSGGIRLKGYQADEPVVITAALLPFTYTFSCTLGTCPVATAYGIPVMSGTIKNNNSVAVAQNVKIMGARYSHTYGKWVSGAGQFVDTRANYLVALSPCVLNPLPISLAPGAEQGFNYAGYCADPDGILCRPLLMMHYTFYWWLEDDAGGKSNEVVNSIA